MPACSLISNFQVFHQQFLTVRIQPPTHRMFFQLLTNRLPHFKWGLNWKRGFTFWSVHHLETLSVIVKWSCLLFWSVSWRYLCELGKLWLPLIWRTQKRCFYFREFLIALGEMCTQWTSDCVFEMALILLLLILLILVCPFIKMFFRLLYKIEFNFFYCLQL